MKTLLPLLASLILAASPALAAADKQTEAPAAGAKQLSSSQQRMVDCNMEACERKGDARKEFMRQCMHGDVKPGGSQQERMKLCNKEAGERKGEERKAFMSACLKKK